MPKYNMTVSPDFNPEKIAGWYIFNTWLQSTLNMDIHLELYNSFETQRRAIREGKVDIIYANPFDAAMLIREQGFSALVKPVDRPDEAVIVTSANSEITGIDELKPGTKIAATDDPDINMIGMRTIESADLDDNNTSTETVISYVVVAKRIINGDADVGFILKEAYDDLSNLVKNQLKVLVTSQISVIYHSLMLGPKLLEHKPKMEEALLTMGDNQKGAGILTAIGMQAWETMEEEDAEFMIDLMETLRD